MFSTNIYNTFFFSTSNTAGAFVADAATMPLHWIYDQDYVESKVKPASEYSRGPEFYSPPSCPFYNYGEGRQSPYGDEVVPIMLSLAEKGHLDLEHCREASFRFCKSYTGRLNKSMQKFLENRELGKDWSECAVEEDMQFLAMMKIPIIVARYAGNPTLMDKLDAAVRMHQTNVRVITAARFVARLLEKIVLGFSAAEALRWAKTGVEFSAEEKEFLSFLDDGENVPFSAAADKYGLNGQLPGCLKASLYGVKIFRGYEMAVRANIVAAGDNVARSWLIGSFLAAEQGTHIIPSGWCDNMLMYEKISGLADVIVESNKNLDVEIEKGCNLPGLFISG